MQVDRGEPILAAVPFPRIPFLNAQSGEDVLADQLAREVDLRREGGEPRPLPALDLGFQGGDLAGRRLVSPSPTGE